jgi:hypothetical protein
MRSIRVVTMLLVLLAGRLTAQDRRLTERLDSGSAAAVQRLVDSARATGLPTEPLVQKALEGKTMGASPARIQDAVAGLLDRLASARDALGPDAASTELVAGASALRAGLTPSSLRQLHALRGGSSLAVPISVLTDLVAQGLSPDEATREVLDLARNGRSDDEFVALRKRIEEQQRTSDTGAPP